MKRRIKKSTNNSLKERENSDVAAKVPLVRLEDGTELLWLEDDDARLEEQPPNVDWPQFITPT